VIPTLKHNSDIVSDIPSEIYMIYGKFILAFYQTFSLASSWGPAAPTELWNLRLRSGSAHWDLALAVEVQQCALISGARGWGRGEEEKRRKGEKEAGKPVIKSRDQVGNYLILSYDICIYIYGHIYIYGSSGNTVSPLEGLSRGYASEVCFGVCFGGMLRGLLRVNFITWNLLHI